MDEIKIEILCKSHMNSKYSNIFIDSKISKNIKKFNLFCK